MDWFTDIDKPTGCTTEDWTEGFADELFSMLLLIFSAHMKFANFNRKECLRLLRPALSNNKQREVYQVKTNKTNRAFLLIVIEFFDFCL